MRFLLGSFTTFVVSPALPDKTRLVGRKWNGFVASLSPVFPKRFFYKDLKEKAALGCSWQLLCSLGEHIPEPQRRKSSSGGSLIPLLGISETKV